MPPRVTGICPVCHRVVAKRAGKLVNHYMQRLTGSDLTEITFGRAIRPNLCHGSGRKVVSLKRS